jgi:hypothetical protein
VKRKIFAAVTAGLLPLAATVPALAHHSAYAFDTERTVVVEGVVTEWFWANPHCLLKFDVEADSGEIVEWVTETQAPANMIDAGWRKNDLKPQTARPSGATSSSSLRTAESWMRRRTAPALRAASTICPVRRMTKDTDFR